MKHIFVLALTLGAFALSPAMAQDHHPHGGGGGGGHPAPAHVSGGGHPTVHSGGSAHMGGSFHNNHRPAIRTVHTTVRTHPHTTTVHRTTVTHGHGHVTTVHHTTSHNIHAVSTHRHVTLAGAHRHVANVRALRRNVTAPRRFHHGAYVRPAGWYAHRWVYGETLPVAWYGSNYWIVDFSLFGLIYPPYGYEWIRVGDDALLVDIDTGIILRVDYGVFY
jgi:Ni/Co efflux regulator RcnB